VSHFLFCVKFIVKKVACCNGKTDSMVNATVHSQVQRETKEYHLDSVLLKFSSKSYHFAHLYMDARLRSIVQQSTFEVFWMYGGKLNTLCY
jgi:hypothetical protein